MYLNFGLWTASLLPAQLVLRHFGADGAKGCNGDTATAEAEEEKENSGQEPEKIEVA